MASRRRGEAGAVAVEFALVLVPFLVLVFGAIQYGVYFWAMQGGSAAARQAARDAAVGSPQDCTAFKSDVASNVNAMKSGAVTVVRDYKNAAGNPVQVGDDVDVTVSFSTYNFHFPFLPFLNNAKVSQTATARVEYVPSLTLGDCS